MHNPTSAQTAVVTAPATRFRDLLGASFRAHFIIFAVVLLYMAAEFTASTAYGHEATVNFVKFASIFVMGVLPVFLLALITLRFGNMVFGDRPKRPFIALCKDLKAFLSDPLRMANGIPMVIAMFFFIRTFDEIKAQIPLYNPFSWDQTFMELDRMIHFGVDPWVLLQPVLGYAPVTFVINVVYNLWFMVMWIIWMWLAFSTAFTHLRLQFFLTFMLCWSIGGSLLAVLLSSAGPCYYGLLGLSPDPFAPLMSYLNEVDKTFPVWALNVQDTLWSGYLGEQSLIVGISAMPSLHNATALLFAFVGWRVNRTLGILLSVFAVFILIGSVHLGWHYAVDAYLGAAITVPLWWVSGRIVTWWNNLPDVRAYSRMLEDKAAA